MTLPESEFFLSFGGRFQNLLLPLLAIPLLKVYIRTLKAAAAKYHPWWEAALHAIHGHHGPTQFGLSRPINQGRRAPLTVVSSADFRPTSAPRAPSACGSLRSKDDSPGSNAARAQLQLTPETKDELSKVRRGIATTTDQKPGGVSTSGNASGDGKKLLERAWDALLEAGHAEATARQYVSWMRDYVLFHDKRHPQEMGVPEVRAFLANGRFSGPAAAQRVEATAATRFLYEVVLQRHSPRGALEGSVESEATRPAGKPNPVYLNGMYGSGVRVKECCRVRVKDVDLERLQLAVRGGKGDQDRVTVLPRRLVERLRAQIERVRRLHEDDLALGLGRVWLPPALRRKYPNAEREFGWQYLFPSNRLSVDPREPQET